MSRIQINLVREPVEQYLNSQISAAQLVRTVDELVAQDRLDRLDHREAQLVDALHEALALYVPDEPTRLEEPGVYIGEPELRQRAERFLAELRVSD